MRIRTERLEIRPFKESDSGDLFEILGDAETMRFCEPPYSAKKTDAFLRSFCIAENAALAAVLKSSEKVIGYILWSPLGEGVYELGWFFNRRFWGMGFAFEGCRAVIDCAFGEASADKIVAETAEPVRSAGLAKKLGMRQTEVAVGAVFDNLGNACDLRSFELTREDYVKTRRRSAPE